MLAYSASPWVAFTCDVCGSTTSRTLDVPSFDAARDASRRAGRGDHCAAVHHGPAEAAALIAPFVAAGMAREEFVMVQSCTEAWEHAIPLLGGDVEGVTWVDADQVYVEGFEPAGAVARVREVAAASPRPLRLVGGPPRAFPERLAASVLREYEVLAHDVAVELDITALCLYDADYLPAEYLRIQRDMHPLVEYGDGLHRNPDFVWSGD